MENFKIWLESLNISPDEVLAMFDYHDSYKNLYPGYNNFDNEAEEEYYFRNRREALQAAQEILHIFQSLPEPIPVFRAIQAKTQQDIDPHHGESWSFMQESALEFGTHANCNFLLSGLIRKSDVNWRETVYRYVLNSYGRWGEQEDEIVIPYPEKLMSFRADPIRRRK